VDITLFSDKCNLSKVIKVINFNLKGIVTSTMRSPVTKEIQQHK